MATKASVYRPNNPLLGVPFPLVTICQLRVYGAVVEIAGLTTAIGFMAQKQLAIDRANATEEETRALTFADTTLEPMPVGQY